MLEVLQYTSGIQSGSGAYYQVLKTRVAAFDGTTHFF